MTGAHKRKAVNLQGHFVPASMQAKYRRLLAKAVFENCAGVALSFVETPAMRAFTQVTGAFSYHITLDCCEAGQRNSLNLHAVPSSLSFLQAIGIGTISRRWISTTALNDEYAERKQQQQKMLEDEQVIFAEP